MIHLIKYFKWFGVAEACLAIVKTNYSSSRWYE